MFVDRICDFFVGEDDSRKLEKTLTRLLQLISVVSAIAALFLFAQNPSTYLFIKAGVWIGMMHDIFHLTKNHLEILESPTLEAKIQLTNLWDRTSMDKQLFKNTFISHFLKTNG